MTKKLNRRKEKYKIEVLKKKLKKEREDWREREREETEERAKKTGDINLENGLSEKISQ